MREDIESRLPLRIRDEIWFCYVLFEKMTDLDIPKSLSSIHQACVTCTSLDGSSRRRHGNETPVLGWQNVASLGAHHDDMQVAQIDKTRRCSLHFFLCLRQYAYIHTEHISRQMNSATGM